MAGNHGGLPTVWAGLLRLLQGSIVSQLMFTDTAFAMTTATLPCASPVGIPNAYILTEGPYYPGDLIRYACLPGFSMTGIPSQKCGWAGAFLGTPPSCNEIDMTADNTNDQSVNVNVKKSKGFDVSDPANMLTFILLMLFLLLLVGILVAGIIYLCCRTCREYRGSKGTVQAAPQKQVRRVQVTESKGEESPVLSPRQVNVTEVSETTHMVRRASNISNLDIEKRRQSVHHFHDLVKRVMRNDRGKKGKAKDLTGTWMPHSNPVRNINTSTK